VYEKQQRESRANESKKRFSVEIILNYVNGSRDRNEVKRPDHPAFDPVTTLRSRPPFAKTGGNLIDATKKSNMMEFSMFFQSGYFR